MMAKKITKITVIDESDDSVAVKNEKLAAETKKAEIVAKTVVKKTVPKTKALPKKIPTVKKVVVKKNTVKAKATVKKTLPAKSVPALIIAEKQPEIVGIKSGEAVDSLIKETLASSVGAQNFGKKEFGIESKQISSEDNVPVHIKSAGADKYSTDSENPLADSSSKKAVIAEIGSTQKEQKNPDEAVTPGISIDNSENVLMKEMTAVKNVISTSVKEQEDKEVDDIVKQKIFATRSVKLYRKIAYFFILLTVILVAIVSYYSFVKVTITLIPNQERISNNMIFDVYDGDVGGNDSGNSIAGIVKLKEINHEIIFDASGAEVIGKEAIGKVTIVNNYNKNQPLVATTRFLSSDGKLFRLSDTVNVPAGGSISAEVYADEPSEEMAIGPTTFSIPGLWAGLQDQIFAKSDESVVYQQKVKKYIVQADIDDSARELKQKLLVEAKDQINKDYQEYGQIIYKIDENSIESKVDKKVGDEVDNFSASMVADVIVVAFDDKKSAELAKQKFISSLLKNKELLSFDDENIIYSLNNYDHVQGAATINATFEGKVSLKEDSDIVEIDKILGLNSGQLDAYLAGLPEIAGYEVKYFPSFIKRVPKLVDRIEVNIKK